MTVKQQVKKPFVGQILIVSFVPANLSYKTPEIDLLVEVLSINDDNNFAEIRVVGSFDCVHVSINVLYEPVDVSTLGYLDRGSR
jgi:hypothetical protein